MLSAGQVSVLLSDTLLALKHFLHIQRIKLNFRLFVV